MENEISKKQGPFPIRLGELRETLEKKAQEKGFPDLASYIKSILSNRENLKSGAEAQEIETLKSQILEKEALIKKAVQKMELWGVKL